MPASPDRATLCLLHQRLLGGDPLASAELLALVLPSLVEEVGRRLPRRVDAQLIHDGAIDALLDYCARPQRFDADNGAPLDRFLCTAARRNVSNLLVGEQRRKRREHEVGKREADVALDPLARNIQQEELRELEGRRAAAVGALDDPVDREVLALQFQGVRDTAAFARVLGISHLPPGRQRQEVKRRKDRINRFLRRRGLLP
jgi:hypothetical protein